MTEPSLSPSSLRIASICRRRQIFTLLLLRSGFHFVPNTFSEMEFSEPFLLQLQRKFQSLDDIESLQQFDLLLRRLSPENSPRCPPVLR